jgi:hypothetical protein
VVRAVDLVQIVSFLESNAWVTLIEGHALLFGAIFLAAGFFLGLLGRGAAYLVLILGGATTGSVMLAQLSASQGTTAMLVAIGISLVSTFALYKAARFLLLPLEFLVFLGAWFLLLYSAYGFGFTTDPVKVALWLVASGASLFVTDRASSLLFRNNPAWKRAPARVGRA